MNRLTHRSGTLPAGRDSWLGIILRAAGIVTMAFGLLALLGWVSGWLRLASFGANMISMAPSSAVLFLLYGVGIGLRARAPVSRRAHGCSVALVGLGTLVALLLFTLGWLHIQWAGEHLGLNPTGTVAGANTGHSSLVSTFCFLLASVSFLASLSPSATRRWHVRLALISAGVLLATSFIFLLAYSFGTPLLYGGPFIPPALNTILAFVPLGLALLTLAGRAGGLFRGLPGDDSKPALIFALIFLFLATGIVAIGYFYFRNYERQFRAEAAQQLAAIAELKVNGLAQYRKERLGDAAILHNNPAFTQLARRFLAAPADAQAQRQLLAWLGKYQTHFQYDQVFLLDAQGGVRMSASESSVSVAAVISARVAEVLRTGQPVFQDLYRHELSQRIYLALLVPIRDEADGNRPLGVLVLRIDPVTYLYPFISRWPVPSATAETLLIRREGNEAVFLNELRFQTNTALTLRSSLANTNLLAVKAALGQEDIVTGLDYRGVPVLAALRAVPDSPWFLVARRDVAEVYALLRAQLWQVIVLVGLLLFGAGAGVGIVWRQQRVRFYQKEAEAAESLRDANQELQTMISSITDGLLVLDHNWHYTYVSETGAKMIGMRQEELIGKCIWDMFPHTKTTKYYEHYHRAVATGQPCHFEEYNPAPLNLWLDVRGYPSPDGLTVYFHDITARKRAEAELAASEIRYRGLFESAQEGILIIESETGMVLDVNPFLIGLLGFSHEQFLGKKIWELGFFKDIVANQDNFAELQRKQYLRYEDLALETSDGRRIPVEFISNVSLVNQQKVIQCSIRDITKHRQAEDALRQSRQAALNLMKDAVAARNRSEQMSQSLRESEERYRSLVETTFDWVWEVDAQGRYTYASPRVWDMLGYRPEEMLGRTPFDLMPEDEVRRVQAVFAQIAARREPFAVLENTSRHRDGRLVVLETSGTPILSPEGTLLGYRGMDRDITERKQAEETLLQSRQAALNLMADAVEARDRSEQMSQALRASEEEIRELNRSLEQRVVERTAELQAANLELNAFAYAVSHDLRQPLRAMNGFSQALVEDFGAALPGAAHEFLNHIIQASHRMGELIDGLLRLSRSTRGEMRRDAVDISTLAARLLGELTAAEPERRVAWTVASGLTARGDEHMIEVVLANLLGNAWKYTARQPVAKIEVGVMDQCCDGVAAPAQNANTPILHHSNTPVFFVRDNGAGFDMKHAAKLFQPFQRLHREDEFPGIGIGLATVQRIVYRHGGTIRATAAPGQGATFSFSLSASDDKNKEQQL